MTRWLSTLMLAGSLVMNTAAFAADEKTETPPATAPAETTAPAKAPVFLTIVPEGKNVQSVTAEEARAREQQAQEERATEGILATVQNLQRIGLFAVQFILALIAAGVVGGLFAALVMWVRSRLRPTGDLR